MDISTLTTQNRLQEAEELILKALQQSPDDSHLLDQWGQIALKKQDYATALNAFYKILSLDPENQQAKAFIQTIRGILSLSNSFYFENTYLDDSLYE